MSRWTHDLVDVHLQILQRAEEPIRTRQINQESANIFGGEWNDSVKRNLGHIRTALRELGVLSHPRRGFWGLMPDWEDKYDALKDLIDDEVYKEYEKLKRDTQCLND